VAKATVAITSLFLFLLLRIRTGMPYKPKILLIPSYDIGKSNNLKMHQQHQHV